MKEKHIFNLSKNGKPRTPTTSFLTTNSPGVNIAGTVSWFPIPGTTPPWLNFGLNLGSLNPLPIGLPKLLWLELSFVSHKSFDPFPDPAPAPKKPPAHSLHHHLKFWKPSNPAACVNAPNKSVMQIIIFRLQCQAR